MGRLKDILIVGLGAYLFDRVMSFVHEGLHVLWAILNGSALGDCGVFGIGMRMKWHGIPQFYVCVEEAGRLPYYFNPLFATVGSVIVAILILSQTDRIKTRYTRWILTAGATYSAYRYSLYSAGLINHPKLVNGELTAWTGDGGTVLEGFGQLGIIPGIIGVIAVTVVVWERLRNSPDACACRRDTTVVDGD